MNPGPMSPLVCRLNGSSSTVKKEAVLLSVVMALLAVSVPLFSQAAVGTILGGVFDSTGGAIAGAQVTILDVARQLGVSRDIIKDVQKRDLSRCYSKPKLKDLRQHLPASTPTISAEARAEQLRQRRIGAQLRRRW